jgi:hypothetical protein
LTTQPATQPATRPLLAEAAPAPIARGGERSAKSLAVAAVPVLSPYRPSPPYLTLSAAGGIQQLPVSERVRSA